MAATPTAPLAGSDRPDAAVLRRALLDGLVNNDPAGVQQGLDDGLARLGLGRFVRDVVAPLTTDIGDAWMQGRLELFQEHLYTELVQRLLRKALAARPASGAQRPHVLLTTASGEPHALGLLMAEVVLTLEGCRCTSLGVQTPVWDIVRAAEALGADVVALSHSGASSPNETLDMLTELRAKLPDRLALWAGGSAPVLRRRAIDGVKALGTLESAVAAVATWRALHPPGT